MHEPSPPPKPPCPDDARRLRDFFRNSGFNESGLVERLGINEPLTPRQGSAPRVLDETRAPTPFNLLARWFLVGTALEPAWAERAVDPETLALFRDSGLIFEVGGRFAPGFLIAPVGELLVTFDPFSNLSSEAACEYVLGVNPTARHLLDFTIREPVSSMLDLCGGSGIQGLAAAAHSDRVVSTDLNPRATALAAFNARLNGLENVRCLNGDAFEPVGEERFDLIVSNPPFVLAPSREFIFRDSGMELDGFCRKLIQKAPQHLNPGGCFQMICEWVSLSGRPWRERLGQWFARSGCDVWVLMDNAQSPSRYAQLRTREAALPSGATHQQAFDHWLTYYREHDVDAVHAGLILMRRRDGANWVRMEELQASVMAPFGEAIHQGLRVRDHLDARGGRDDFLKTAPRLAPGVELHHTKAWQDGAWVAKAPHLVQTRGLQRRIGLAFDVADFLSGFDGSRSLHQAIADLASRATAEPANVEGEALQLVRHMLDLGFLEP